MDSARRRPLISLIRRLVSRALPATDAFMEECLDSLDSAVRADAFTILKFHTGSGTFRVLAGRNLRLTSRAGTGSIEAPRIGELLLSCGSGKVREDGGPFEEDPFLEGEETGMLLLACTDFGTERFVTAALRHRREKFTSSEKQRFLAVSGVINLMAACSHFIHAHARHRDFDPLTGLGLYPSFHDILEKEISRSRRSSSKITVGILKVAGSNDQGEDDSKPGDSTTLLVADILVKQLRNFDTVIRYSGAEFALILPDIGGENAEKVMNRIMDTVRSSNGNTAVRLYAGFSCYPEDGSTAERLIETAEAALNRSVEEKFISAARWKE